MPVDAPSSPTVTDRSGGCPSRAREGIRAGATVEFGTPSASSRPLTIATGRWSSSCLRLSSWHFSTRAPARPTSARTSRRRWAFRRRSGSKIRSAGISRFIRTDKARWSGEAARLLLTGEPLRSVYRVIARDGRVVWFHCEAKIVHRDDGQPWFIHGVAFDITDVKKAEIALDEERNFVTAILDTVGALVVVLDPSGRHRPLQPRLRRDDRIHVRRGASPANLGPVSRPPIAPARESCSPRCWPAARRRVMRADGRTGDGRHRLIAWSHTVLDDASGAIAFVIATGLDVTDRRMLETAVLDISEREQVRIGQDLHDGLGQHLTGVRS